MTYVVDVSSTGQDAEIVLPAQEGIAYVLESSSN